MPVREVGESMLEIYLCGGLPGGEGGEGGGVEEVQVCEFLEEVLGGGRIGGGRGGGGRIVIVEGGRCVRGGGFWAFGSVGGGGDRREARGRVFAGGVVSLEDVEGWFRGREGRCAAGVAGWWEMSRSRWHSCCRRFGWRGGWDLVAH